jgi:predicted PolB exonuclease-like 3'-5' exonuclease
MSKRADSVGLFWEDLAPVKAPKKEKVVRVAPERFWEKPDYLPSLQEALTWQPDLINDMELYHASEVRERFTFDIEIYPNYCLFAFKSIVSKKVIYFELYEDGFVKQYDREKLEWVIKNICFVTFNGRHFDMPVTELALLGHDTGELWNACCMLIVQKLTEHDVRKHYKTKALKVDQIDLKGLAPLNTSLKAFAARLHAPKLQDLPVAPGTYLSANQIAVVRFYCINDLDNTELLYYDLLPQIVIRESQGDKYKLDLRSHSDAQMAEAIIKSEIRRISGKKYLKPTKLPGGTSYQFKVPHFVKFQTPMMNSVLDIIRNVVFKIDHIDGNVIMPHALADLVITIADGKYKMGMGGLHSQEKTIAHTTVGDYIIADTDATSYYPKLILNAGITPTNLGADFLIIYNGIVVERISAKHAGYAAIAECLKIVVNGTFGKLGSVWSIMYAPDLMIQVTVGGQLSILMLVERFELAGIEVTSVNTDGIVAKYHKDKQGLFTSIVKQWEKETGFDTEEVRYAATYSRDINNYIAVYDTPQKGKLLKAKGAYGDTCAKKNAVTEICIKAVKDLITTQTPIADTVMNCRDIRLFTNMRQCPSGALKGDQYLGKVARWYYAVGEEGFIISAKKGSKIARTDGAKPCQDLPKEFPTDINYNWYINEAYSILEDIGYKSELLSEY